MFSPVIVACKSKSEQLYKILEHKLKDKIKFYEECEILDRKDSVSGDDEQSLMIFDDILDPLHCDAYQVRHILCFLRHVKSMSVLLYINGNGLHFQIEIKFKYIERIAIF